VQDVERIECQDTPPASWEWQRLPNMTEPRVSHAAVRCGSQLMVLGGLNEDGYLQGTEIFNDATGEWQYVGDLNRPRSGCAAVAYDVVEEGDVWVVGGGDGEATNEGEVYRRQKWRICRAESRPVGEGGAFRLEDDAMLGAEPELDDGTKHVPRRAGSKAEGGPGLGRKSFRPRQSKAALNREGQAYTMSDVKQDHDSLELHKRQEMQVLYASHGDSKVVFSANVSKMNRKGKVQARVLCITDLHVFNLDKKCKPMWSQPLSSLALAVETPLLHGVLLCFDNESGGGRVSCHDTAQSSGLHSSQDASGIVADRSRASARRSASTTFSSAARTRTCRRRCATWWCWARRRACPSSPAEARRRSAPWRSATRRSPPRRCSSGWASTPARSTARGGSRPPAAQRPPSWSNSTSTAL